MTSMPTLTTALRHEYQLLFESCLIRPARNAQVSATASQIVANKNRYHAVADSLGMPWYVIGLIHAMESSLSFSGHLYNGDPLSARTVHWPPGRPASGNPPFSWEQSATDAIRYQGLAAWKDWSLPGTLFKLELYNGWGYRGVQPPIPTPYLWSFSNHYGKGKYVSDGSYSPTAVSQQAGAAVLLKRLVQLGAAPINTASTTDGTTSTGGQTDRVLQLANPHMTGPDVTQAQQLLTDNAFGNFEPGTPDGDYGSVSADATRRAKWALGYPSGQVNGSFGPLLRRYLQGTKALPAAYQRTRKQRLAAAPDENAIRAAIVKWALWGVQNTNRIAYSQGATRFAALGAPGALPLATDCSGFTTLCFSWSNAPNPNCPGPYRAEAGGFTGTMLNHCKRIPQSTAKPGDLVIWTPPASGAHVCIVASSDADPWLVSHGDDSGPKKLRFSVEDAAQRSRGHGEAVFLTAF